MKKVKNNKTKGFTFVEVLAVVALISILAAIAIPVVSKYVGKGKDTYMDSLKEELELAGKAYFSYNKKLLPVKPTSYVDQVATTYVTEPTLRTSNYLSKELVDSDGRECTDSYVFVRQDENTTKNNYHACLICGEKNYSENDEYCYIKDFKITKQPTCKEVNISSYQRLKDGIYYNPDLVKIEKIDTSLISSIRISKVTTEGTTEEKTLIRPNEEKIDVSETNLVDYFPKKNGEVIDGKYSVTILNNGGQESKCIDNIVFDHTKPTCELYYNNDLLSIESSDNYSKNENLSEVINKKASLNDSELRELRTKQLADPISVTPGTTYYGHVMDEAGNTNRCVKTIEKNQKEDPVPTPTPDPVPNPTPDPEPTPKPEPTPPSTNNSPPYCWFSKDSPSGWLKIGSTAKLQITCKSVGTNVKENKGNLSAIENLGTLSSATKSTNYVYNTTYKPKNNKTGTDNVKIGAGFIKDSNGSNVPIWSADLKIDTVAPVASITFDGTKKDGFYVKGVKIILKCTDKGSGVKSVKLNTNDSNSNTVTVTNTMPGKSLSYTGICYDKAGNSHSVTKEINVKEYSADKDCGCAQNVSCKEYYSCENSSCACSVYKSCKSCGCKTYSGWSSNTNNSCSSKCYGGGTGQINHAPSCKKVDDDYKIVTCTKYVNPCRSGVVGGQGTYYHCVRKVTKTRSCNQYKSCSSCGCKTYKSCKNSSCGCKTWNNCSSYKKCYHY